MTYSVNVKNGKFTIKKGNVFYSMNIYRSTLYADEYFPLGSTWQQFLKAKSSQHPSTAWEEIREPLNITEELWIVHSFQRRHSQFSLMCGLQQVNKTVVDDCTSRNIWIVHIGVPGIYINNDFKELYRRVALVWNSCLLFLLFVYFWVLFCIVLF